MSHSMIEADGTSSIAAEALTKTFGDVAAVQGLSFAVEPGEIFGFLGPNGAGKTTTIRMLMGIAVPSSGSVRIQGFDCHRGRVEVARRTGFVSDSPTFPDFLRGLEVLEFVAEMHGLPRALARKRAPALLEELGLSPASHSLASDYSAGMKKRLALACALVHEPAVLVLDEPSNGLDPLGAREMNQRLKTMAAAGGTVFLSTHLLSTAETLCSRVAILNRGRLVVAGPLAELRKAGQSSRSLEEIFLQLTAEADAE
jgi:ABC-2 type transport system ATP-binding protein